MRSCVFRIVSAACCYVLSASLVLAAETVPSQSELLKVASALEGTRYYGCYFAGKKAGWQVETWTSQEERICVSSELYLMVAVLGANSVSRTTSTSCFQAHAPFVLESYQMRQQEDDSLVEVSAKRTGENLLYRVVSNGNVRESSTPVAQETLVTAIPWAAYARMLSGDTVTTVSFDAVAGKNRTTRVVMKEQQERVILGSKQKVYRVQVAEEGSISLDGWLGPDGQLLEATFGSVFRISAEDQKTALDMTAGPVDLYRSMFVSGKGKIDAARAHQATRMQVTLKGESELALSPLHRQRTLAKGPNWLTLEVDACPPPNLETPLPEDSRCTTDVPCDLEQVQAIALEAAGTAKTPLEQGNALALWIHKNFRYTVGGTSGTADLLLKRRTGDCSEFSKVMVLLARSLGLAAREVTGIVLADPDPLVFGYHAWTQLYLPDLGWVDFDPTWGHFPVDATHIALGVREDLSSIIHLGTLSVQVERVDYSVGPLTCPQPEQKANSLPQK